MMTSNPHSEKFIDVTISKLRTLEIIQGVEEGTIDLDKITMSEWLQVSFLAAVGDGDIVHVTQKMMYGGNLYSLHACVEQIVPNQQVSSIRKIQ